MIEIQNTQECFVQLWLRLERTRRLLRTAHKRFCIRRVLKAWFGLRANDDFIWEVCHMIDLGEYSVGGYEELPSPRLYPRLHREFLRAIVAAKTGISYYRVHLKELDAAYSVAFPNSTPINVNKKSAHSQPCPPSRMGDSLPFVGPKPHSVASLKTPVAHVGEEMEGVERPRSLTRNMDVYNEHEYLESHECAAKGYAAFECNPSIAHQEPFPSLGTLRSVPPNS